MKLIVAGLLAALLTVVTGCGTMKLREDPVIPAAVAGYPTLEFSACGKTYHGLGVCYLNRGEAFDSVELRVQGYFQGTGRVVSQACKLDYTFTYKDSELIRIKLPNSEPEKNCAVNITLSPEYPKEWRSGIEVYSLIGVLAVRLQDGEETWSGETRRLTGNWKSNLHLSLGPAHSSARVVIRGCGIAYDKALKAEGGELYIPLEQAVKRQERGLCVAEGVALTNGVDFTFSVLIAQYATELPNDPKWAGFGFGPLAIPVTELSGSKIKLTGAEQVSVVSMDRSYEVQSKASFKFDRNKPHIIRLITVKGRTVLGFWEPGDQEVRWVQ